MKFKIKDKVILGTVGGALATTLLNFVDYLSVLLHVNNWHIWQIAGSLLFKKEELTTLPALILGAFTHTTLMGLAGVIISYILYFTGRTLYVVKGVQVFLLFWIVLFGGVLGLGITTITQPVGVQTNIAHFVGHFAGGVLSSYLIVRLADQRAWEKPAATVVIADDKITEK